MRTAGTSWIAGSALTGALALGLAGCGGGGGGADPSPAPSASVPGVTGTPQASAAAAAEGKLTPPGTRLGFGQSATVGWVPLDQDASNGPKKGLDLQVTVVSIQKGSIEDFKNVQLDAGEKNSTPYYVTVRLKALGRTPPTGTDDPDIQFRAIDDRGQEQSSVTFLGTFDRCDDKSAPKPFVSGRAYSSCLAYLMPGGGSIQRVEWNNGPAAANQVTPYFEKPVVWAR